MEEHFLLFLLLAGLVGVVDFLHIVGLLAEETAGLHHSVVQVHISPVFFRFEVEVIEKLN